MTIRASGAGPDASSYEFVSSVARSAFGLSYRLHSSRTVDSDASPRPVFVLVHGIGMSHHYFDRLRGELLDHGDVVVFDLPGFGGTPRPAHQLSVADYARVIGGALDQARIDRCIVVGHSMGTQFVTDLALQRPDVVSAVVLIGPVTDTAHPSVARNALTLAVDTLLEKPSTNLLVAGAYLRCGLRWYRTELPVMLGYRLDEQLARVSQPVLIVRGTRDVIAGRQWCARLGRTARSASVVEVQGQPHNVQRDGHRRVGQAIVRLADSLGPEPETSAIRTGGTHPASGDGPEPVGTEPAPVDGRGPSRPLDLRGVDVGDRQCRAYLMPHQAAEREAADAEQEAPVPVFMVVQGIGMSHRYVRRLGHRLSRHGRVLLIDLPGYGWTRRPARRVGNPVRAELLAALLDDMGVSSGVLVGYSTGAQAATELAIQRPDLVSHLVLIGAAGAVVERAYRPDERLPPTRRPVLVLRASRDVITGLRWCRKFADRSPGRVAAAIVGFVATDDGRLPAHHEVWAPTHRRPLRMCERLR